MKQRQRMGIKDLKCFMLIICHSRGIKCSVVTWRRLSPAGRSRTHCWRRSEAWWVDSSQTAACRPPQHPAICCAARTEGETENVSHLVSTMLFIQWTQLSTYDLSQQNFAWIQFDSIKRKIVSPPLFNDMMRFYTVILRFGLFVKKPLYISVIGQDTCQTSKSKNIPKTLLFKPYYQWK